MLVLTRKVGEQIVIDGNICISIVQVGNGRVKIGIQAPPTVKVDRQEIHDRKAAEVEEGQDVAPALHNRIAAKLPVDPRKPR